jgi:hypothetical protein
MTEAQFPGRGQKLHYRESPTGLIIATEQLSPELRKQRREDNRAMAKSRKFHRRRKKHGRP